MQNRTHTCDELRLSDAGKRVQLSGWMDSVRIVSANLAFVILRDSMARRRSLLMTRSR